MTLGQFGSSGCEMITKQQYKRLMSEYKKDRQDMVSAMKADVDPHTARKYIEAGQCPAELASQHTWRTRPDPLAKVWAEVTQMLRDAPELKLRRCSSIFWLARTAGWRKVMGRTFSRRVRQWRATQGRAEVFLRRIATPASCWQLDWTHAREFESNDSGRSARSPLLPLACCLIRIGSGDRCISESFLVW